MGRTKVETLSKQVKSKVENAALVQDKKELEGNMKLLISSGSTLLDLAVSGGRVHGGGFPGGIFVEIFGPNGSGKTILLCEMAGDVQRKGGQVRFDDPEGRLNTQFAQMFDLDTAEMDYDKPDMVTEVFQNIRAWQPKNTKLINGTFTDSLAALSTALEMGEDEGDKMGMRRAKEFSEGLRKNARILVDKNYIMVCSNQIRDNASGYGPKTESPGGKAIGFYASVRLKAAEVEKITVEKIHAGKKIKKVIGIKTTFEVYKNSVWKPYRTAPVYIIFDYGVDDIRANLQYIKDFTKNTTYTVGGESVGVSMEEAIAYVENNDLVATLKEEVISLWEEIEGKFEFERKPKSR